MAPCLSREGQLLAKYRSARMLMGSDSAFNANVAERLQRVTNELRDIENLLVHEKLDSSVLTDFRDAVNRVRTTAWAVAQYLDTGTNGEQSATVLSLLANERVRVTYRLCRLIEGDLANGKVQSGPMVQLYLASQDLAHKLSEMLGRDGHQAASAHAEPAAH